MAIDLTDDQIIQQAEMLLGFRKADDAINLLRSKEAPNNPRFCAVLARAYNQRGDTRGDVYASHYFATRAIQLGNTTTTVYAIAAVTAFRKERFADAVKHFGKYVDEQAGTATQFMYGLSLLHVGQAQDALPWLQRVAGWEPNNAEYQAALKKCQARLAGQDGEPKRAWHKAERGLGGPNDTRPLNVDSPYQSNAISKLRGVASTPKDFHWLEKNIPCQAACPANTDIPSYLHAIYKGEYDKAYKINLHDNVFPAVLGRVCSRPCESQCRHGWDGLGEPIAICFSKRSAADFKKQGLVVMDPWFPKTGKKVAVVGAGPGGLAAARNLALFGHDVTVYEKHSRPGGMMNQGIPEFRLPRDIIDQEIEQVRRQGVKIVCNTAIGKDLPLEKLVAENDAVVLAAGTIRPNLLNIPGKDLKGIRHGLDFLLDANETRSTHVGEDILVIGGGFTAMDCARTAARLGAKTVELELETTEDGQPAVMRLKGESVKVLYRRSQTEMLITPGELEELNHEGIPMHFMVSPKAYIGKDGHVIAMRFVRTELGEPDASGRRKPVEVAGSEFDVPATTVLLATGQFPETSWIEGGLREKLVDEDEWLKSGKAQKTAVDKVFVAGDFATGARTLIEAIAHGKDAAAQVDTFLMGEQRLCRVAVVEDVTTTQRIREMDYVDRQPMPMLPVHHRSLAAEVEQGFTPELSVEETQRCYLCHYKFEIDPDKCIYCDWCIKAKPRPDCIVKVSSLIYDGEQRITGFWRAKNTEQTKLIWINQADCIRCGACVEACPVDAISIQKVSLRQQRKSDGTSTVDLPTNVTSA
jgi:NADPH-dependent glutamate synthase beta subunit-like oxidoreductase/ferredoxin